VTLVSESPSPNVFSADADFDFSALADAEVDETDTPLPPSGDRVAEEKVCPVCDLPIVRDPSWKRMRKYHDECKPSTITGRPPVERSTASRATKAEREADECVVLLKKQLVRGAMFAMMADPYDGFVIMTGIPGICENIRGILVTHDKWRKDALALKTGGSILGLVISLFLLILPILAHHSLIPSVKLRQMLQDMPVILFKISQRMKEGETAMNDMMERVAEQALKPQPKSEGGQNGSPNVPPFFAQSFGFGGQRSPTA